MTSLWVCIWSLYLVFRRPTWCCDCPAKHAWQLLTSQSLPIGKLLCSWSILVLIDWLVSPTEAHRFSYWFSNIHVSPCQVCYFHHLSSDGQHLVLCEECWALFGDGLIGGCVQVGSNGEFLHEISVHQCSLDKALEVINIRHKTDRWQNAGRQINTHPRPGHPPYFWKRLKTIYFMYH